MEAFGWICGLNTEPKTPNFRRFSEKVDFAAIAKATGYKKYFYLNKKENIKKIIKKFFMSKGPNFLEVAIKTGTMKGLLRPKNLIKIKKQFMIK